MKPWTLCRCQPVAFAISAIAPAVTAAAMKEEQRMIADRAGQAIAEHPLDEGDHEGFAHARRHIDDLALYLASTRMFSTCFSSDRSATSFFNLPFSVSSCLSFLA